MSRANPQCPHPEPRPEPRGGQRGHRHGRPGRRLPITAALRLGRPSDIWFKPALSVIAAVAPPNLILLALGRLDLAMYTMAGSLCALYAHNRPYRARARVLAWVVLGMTAGLAVALLTASLTRDAVALVTVGALLAAAQKALCDATRLGPPSNVVLTFISSAALFAPQSPGQVPGHLGLALAAGAWSWLIGMAPGLLRPHGPERRATAHALATAAAHAVHAAHPAEDAPDDSHARTRAAAAAAVHAAWQTLLSARATQTRRALERLVVRAEIALAAPRDTDPKRLRDWARDLRGTGPVPRPDDLVDDDELLGVDAELATGRPSLRLRLGPLAPIAARTALGCALAGYASLAVGVGRPYWALVTAASLYQANITLTWSRGVQRVVGNLIGVSAFAALVPLAHLTQAALVLICLALNFGAEALISRNYWLGSVLVTPMALLITEFAQVQDPGRLITERLADTLVGAVVGFAAGVAVTNRRAGDRLGHALTAVEQAREQAARLLAEPCPAPGALESARRRLATTLVDLRGTADAASGEWWQRALPEERVVAAEQSGHRTLAATVRRQGLLLDREASTGAEDVRR
ncbi:putative membrane protein YccC [Streptomyces sp. 3330]|uniref:FUSC family protein n=1 Tax=Streptomyces sp. 3330 TaxID=2817755 RepID=UPI0028569D36|nr:FUSC family protein [Streptomyces sp. 3330]MDR6975173.1 putative membrane protein YccC [Streptomyces sp. 3330]